MRADLVKHAGAGLAAAVFGCGVWLACLALGYVSSMDGAPVMSLFGAVVAGAVKEVADALSNKAQGREFHGVGWDDFFATAAPGAALATLLHYAAR